MRLQSHVSFFAFLASIALFWPCAAAADTAVLRDRAVFGRLISVSDEIVRFAPSCGQAIEEYSRDQVSRIERNTACTPRPIQPYSAGGDVCDQRPLRLHEIVLREPKTSFLVANFAIVDERLHLTMPSGLVRMHGPADRFVSATNGLFCRTKLPPDLDLEGFCIENTSFAVNFGADPVFENRILTQGISFFLEDDEGRAIPTNDTRSGLVRNAFGNALSHWLAALQDARTQLPVSAQESLAGMISRSTGGTTMLTPPQVVRVGCPDTAMFTVRYLSDDVQPVTIGGRVKHARAQIAGRTIYLNGVTVSCWRASLLKQIVLQAEEGISRCLNLTPVFTHELGHAFGLSGHHNGPTGSIMDSVIYADVAWPTSQDALMLAQVLLEPIQGATTGHLDDAAMGVEVSTRARPVTLEKPPQSPRSSGFVGGL